MARSSSTSRSLDPPRHALVEVHGPGVDLLEGPGRLDGADQRPVLPDDPVLDVGPRPQADPVGREAPSRPHRGRPAVGPPPHGHAATEDQPADGVVEQAGPVLLVGPREGPFERRACQVGAEHERVGRVDHGRLGRPREQLVGVADQPLVELVVAGDEDGQALLGLPPGPPGLLPERGDGAGEAVEHAGVEPADVDAELQGVGGDDAAQVAAEQLLLDLPPLGGQVAAPVGPHRAPPGPGEAPVGVGGDDLGHAPAAAEGDGPPPVADQLGQEPGRLGVGRHRPPLRASPTPPTSTVGGRHRATSALAAGRAVVGDGLDRRAPQGGGQPGRVADGGRAPDEASARRPPGPGPPPRS